MKTWIRTTLLATTISVALAGMVCAETAEGTGPMTDGQHEDMRGMPHNGHMMKQMQIVRDSLKLNPAQSALWDAALKTSHENFANMRKSHEQMKAALEAQKSQDVLDLNQLSGQMDAIHAEAEQQHKTVRDAWLKVYNGLTQEQKKIASTAIRLHLAQIGEHHHGFPGMH